MPGGCLVLDSEGLKTFVVLGFVSVLNRCLPIGSIVVPFWDCLVGF